MNKPQYHYHFQQKTTEWIRAQISVYFSLSILQPPSSLTTTIHRSWLLCLAHRYFPSSVPDLIFRLKQHKDDDYDDVNFVYQLFVDHWNLKYTMKDCIFTFVDTIRQHVTQYNLTTPSNNILAVIRSMPSFKCMQLDFIHMKLFTATVLHNVTDLDHRMQHIYFHYDANKNNTQEENDDQEKKQYDFLRNCLDRIQAITQQGEFILHKIGNQTKHTTTIANDVTALLELDNSSNIQLSDPLRLQLIKPLEKYHHQQYTQRFQQRLQWIKELQQTWIAEYNNVITLIQCRHEKEQDNEKEDDVKTAMNIATLAYQRWSGASPIANTTLYTAMQKQYCEFQKRQDQMTSQKKHVEAFVQYTDDLQEEGRRLLSLVIEESSSTETLSLAIQSFKDRVYIASERMDARIPYPAHQALRNDAIQDMVQRKKASLWMLQDDLDHKLRLYQRKQQHQHQQSTKDIQDDNDLWINMRIEAVQDLLDSTAMPGLTLEDIQQLKKDCRDYRITTLKRKQQSNTKLETLLKQLQNNLDAYERRVRKSDTAEKLSANIQEKTERIWSILIPIEEGKFDVENVVPKTFSDEATSLGDTDLLLSEEESDAEYAWIRRQHQDFVSLINYGNALLAQRTTCQLYQSKVKELLAEGTRHCHTLEPTWNNLARSNYNRHYHQRIKLHAYDDFVKQSDMFLLQVNRQNLLPLFPCKNVQANRIAPYIPENTFLGWLSRQCTALTELSSTVSLLVQKCRYVLDIKSSMESWLNNISTCTPNDEVYQEQEKEVKSIRARVLNAPGCDALVKYWDQVSLDALYCFGDQILKRKQAEQQRMADIAAEGAFTSWQKTVVDFDTAVPDDNDHLTYTQVEQLEALYQSNKISFEKILYVFSAAGRPLTTKMHGEQQRVASILQTINTKYHNQKAMAKYNELHILWQQNMEAALQLCDEQEANVTTLIHNNKMLITQHNNRNKESNNDHALLLLPPTPPPTVATLPKVPDIENLRHHVAQHSLYHRVGFDQVLASQLTLDKRIQHLNDTTKFAANIQVQCSKIKQIIDDLMYLKNNDDASIMEDITKQINNPELYPARCSFPDDIEFNKSIRYKLESLFNDALNQQQIRAETSKQYKIHQASNSIIKEFQKKVDDAFTSNLTQKTVNELTLSAHNCIVKINQQFIGINSDDNNNKKYQDSIASILATVEQSWKEQTMNVAQKEKQQKNQTAMDEYRALYNWLTEQHNSIQITDVDDSKAVTEQRNILQQLERSGIDALYVLYQNEKKQQEIDSTHVQEMRVLFERAKGDHKDLVAALNYVDELFSKKQLEKSRQSYVDGLLSTMRVMMTWAEQNQEFTVTRNTSRQDMDRIEYKASKALYLFKAQVHVYPEYQELQLQYQQTQSALEEVICAVRSAKPYCDMHIELDEIEASIKLLPSSVLDTMLDDIAHQVNEAVMDSSEKLHREQVRNRYDELVKLVDLIKTQKEKEKRQSEEIEAQKEAGRQRLAIEQAIQAAKRDTLAVGAVVDDADPSMIHEFYLCGISTLSIHQARRIKWCNDELNEAVCDLEGSYACLNRVAQHAKQAQDIMTWITKWEGQDVTETASIVEKFLGDNVSDEAPLIIKSSVELATKKRRTSVQEAWSALCVQMKHAEAMEAQRLKEQHEQEQLATVKRLIKRAQTQLSHCRWEVDKKDLASMPREPEALAIERRVTDLSATTANLLREHYPNNIQTDENEAYRAIVDTSIGQFFDTVQDTQCKIAQALAISEYLMISDDIHMMISIFEESLPKASIRNISKQDLQAIEAQQKYYDEHIEQELETAQEIAVDNPMLNKPYKQLCDRWASVKRHVQSLLRRGRVTRGRLTSLPILPAFNTSTTTNTVTTYTTNNTTASSLTSTSNIDNNYNYNPSPLVSASSPLSPRPVNSINNINKKKRLIYEPDPENQLDVEIGRIVNQVPFSVKVEMVPGEVGRYWFGSRLVYCRILKSRMVMLRVGGGWCELSQFMRDHAMLHDANDIHIVSDEQGFIQMNTTRRPSLPPPLYHSSSSSTISTTSTSSSGYYMDGDRYMAVDHHGKHHTLKMKKVDGLLNSSGSRSILIK
ncbi:hypothetical protein BDC45DRAFT_519758 [Circinella umbellata]|nr:hypothetical protein BDC45DRAFT_519758 [Circinella umbellata]